MNGTIILDIDNCVSNDAWRIPLIDWSKTGDARYHAYHAAAFYDQPGFDWLLEEYPAGQFEVIFVTTRPARYRTLTKLWLTEHTPRRFVFRALIMRNDNDTRPSAEVKRDAVRNLSNAQGIIWSSIIAAYDDREDIVAAYAELGLVGGVRALHNVCAYSPPSSVPAAAPPQSVPEILRSAAETYAERNKVYGDNYKSFGNAMLGLFPRGVTVNSAEEWVRLGLIFNCMNKITRYAQTYEKGGHVDSAHDLSVYAAMLQEMTNEAR